MIRLYLAMLRVLLALGNEYYEAKFSNGFYSAQARDEFLEDLTEIETAVEGLETTSLRRKS